MCDKHYDYYGNYKELEGFYKDIQQLLERINEFGISATVNDYNNTIYNSSGVLGYYKYI